MPGRLKIPSVMMAPASSAAEVDAQERHHRDERVAHGVDADHPPGGQPLGPGRAHVVGPHRLGQAGPGQAGHVAQRQRPQDEGGQDVAAEPFAGAGHREPAQLDPEEELGHLPEDEHGDGHHHRGRHQHQGVDERLAPQPGHGPGDQADDRLEDEGEHAELDGDRPALAHLVGHGPAPEVLAEVALEDTAHVLAVLDEERVVEVVAVPQLGPHGGSHGLLAREGVDRIAGDGVDQGEDQERGPEEDGDDLEDPAGQIPPQLVLDSCQLLTDTSATTIRLKGSMCTSLSRSEWTAWVSPNHSGATGMSVSTTFSASW